MNTIANKIKYQRKVRKGITQSQLASLLNVSRSSVNNWEAGVSSPTLQNLIMLSNVFDVSIDYFISSNKGVDEILLNKLTASQKEVIVNLINCYKTTK